MRFKLELGTNEKVTLDFCRDPWLGEMRVVTNGVVVAKQSRLNALTHFSFACRRMYLFSVGAHERHEGVLEHRRPLLLAAFRPHNYRVFVDGELLHEATGY